MFVNKNQLFEKSVSYERNLFVIFSGGSTNRKSKNLGELSRYLPRIVSIYFQVFRFHIEICTSLVMFYHTFPLYF